MIIVIILILIAIIGSIQEGKFKGNKFFILLILIAIIPGLFVAFYYTVSNLISSLTDFGYLLIGLIVGVPFAIIIKRFSRFTTFEHEATHALIAMVFFNRITKFVFTKRQGGYIAYKGGLNGWFPKHMISLAPYYFPLFAFIFIILRPLVGDNLIPWWDIWIGMWIMFYIFSYMSEILGQWSKRSFNRVGAHENVKTDIGKEGYIFSFVFIISLSLFFYGLLFNVILYNYTGIWNYITEIYNQNLLFY